MVLTLPALTRSYFPIPILPIGMGLIYGAYPASANTYPHSHSPFCLWIGMGMIYGFEDGDGDVGYGWGWGWE